MAEGTLDSLCEFLVRKLEHRRKKNLDDIFFFPKDTAKVVFDNNHEELQCILSQLLNIPFANTASLRRLIQEKYANIFAILLSMKEREALLQFTHLLGDSQSAPSVSDEDLPINYTTAQLSFLHYGHAFHDAQFLFCPVILNKKEKAVYNDDRGRCPLPYLEQEEIGSGSFGRVWKVKIAENHLLSHGGQNGNITPVTLARKDFAIARATDFDSERTMLEDIINQRTRNKSITLAVAALQHENVYSIFFPLATCDLWAYLRYSTNFNIQKPSDFEAKRQMLFRASTLAGALGYLHNELENTETLRNISCYHLDLKPQNILIFEAGTDKEEWKISDFGISRVKSRQVYGNQAIDFQFNIPLVGRTDSLQIMDRQLTLPPRPNSTYTAPEYLAGGRVNWASDIWSYGCILSLVISFMDNGSVSVHAFSDKRIQFDGEVDRFFAVRNNKACPSKAVFEWFEQLKAHARRRDALRRNAREHAIVSQTLDYLQGNILKIEQGSRKTAKEVEKKLREIIVSQAPGNPPKKPTRKWYIRAAVGFKSPKVQKFDLDHNMTSCLYSPGGQWLAFYSPEHIQVFRMRQETEPTELNFRPTGIGSWECLSVSSSYLCAAVKTTRASHDFECHLFRIPSDPQELASMRNPLPVKIRYPGAGSILSVAMSADGEFTAFVTSCVSSRGSDCLMYLVRTPNMEEPVESSPSSSIRSHRSASNASSATSETVLASKNIITQNLHISSVQQILRLIFSRHGQYLVIVAQQKEDLLIQAWDTSSKMACYKQKLLRSKVPTSSSEKTFTACSIFDTLDTGPCLVLLLQCKYLLVIQSWGQPYLCTLVGSYHDILAREHEGQGSLILIGKDGHTNVQQTYELSMSEVRPFRECTPVVLNKENINPYTVSTDSAVLVNGVLKEQLLVCKRNGTFHEIDLPESNSSNL